MLLASRACYFYALQVGIHTKFDYNQMSENEHYRKLFEHLRGMHGN